MDYEVKLNLANMPGVVNTKKNTITKATPDNDDKKNETQTVSIHNVIGDLIRKAASDQPEIESQHRLSQLKDKIRNGQYHIDYATLADKLTNMLVTG